VIGPVGIVDIVLGAAPEAGDHFVQQPALRGVGEDVLLETAAQGSRLLEELLLATGMSAYPGAPFQALESL